MWKLVIKDVLVSREYLVLLLTVLAGISFGFCRAIVADVGLEVEMYVLVVIISSLIASKLFLIMEETTQTASFFASIPVTRTQLVLSKYLSSFLFMAIAIGVQWTVIQLCANERLLEEAAFIFRPALWIITPILLILSDAFSYPFYFRFGFLRGALFNGFTLISLMILTVMIIRFYVPQDFAQNLIHWISGLQAWVVYLGLIGIISLILGSSVLISINIYKRRDL